MHEAVDMSTCRHGTNSNPSTSQLSTLQVMRGSVGLDLRRPTDDLRQIGRGMSRLQTARSGTRALGLEKLCSIIHRPYYQVSKIITCEGKSNRRSLPSCTSRESRLSSAYRAKAARTRPTRPAPELPSLTAAPVWAAPVEEPDAEPLVLVAPLDEAVISLVCICMDMR